MTPERFARVKEVFALVLETPEEERPARLARECGDDVALAREVEELLAGARAATGFLTGCAAAQVAAAPVELEPRTIRIEGYTIERPLGHGAMGVVYLARQHSPAREVAIKCLRLDCSTPSERERFRREAEILARLAHPGIAQVFGAGTARTEAGELPWISMEYVRGRSLHEHVARLDLRARIELLAEISRAVEHAHSKGIVHRDLKPANVLVDEAGRVRVLDFGVARLAGEIPDAAMRTRTGQVLGTLAYMSPEQARGATNAADARADVYALGVIGYELAAGRLPLAVDDRDVLGAIATICDESPQRLRRHRRDAPADLETILGKALAKEPERRYASAGELEADLLRLLADRPIAARRPTALYHVRKFVRRNRVLTVATVAVIAALAASLWVTGASLRSERAFSARTSEALGAFATKMVDFSARLGFGEEDGDDLLQVVALIEGQLAQDPSSRALRAARADLLYQLSWLDQSQADFLSMRDRLELARAAREGLAREDPRDLESLTQLSQIYAKLGEAERDLGDLAGRDAWFERALSLDERLVREHPSDWELVEDLCWSLARVGQAAEERGDFQRSDVLCGRRLALAEELVARFPEHWKLVHNLANARFWASKFSRTRGDLDCAAEHVRENVRLSRRLCELEPNRRDFATNLISSLQNAEEFHASQGDSASAQAARVEAASLAEVLFRKDPSRWKHAEALLGSVARLFDALLAANDTQSAARVHERLRELATSFAPAPTPFEDHILDLCARFEQDLRVRQELASSRPP